MENETDHKARREDQEEFAADMAAPHIPIRIQNDETMNEREHVDPPGVKLADKRSRTDSPGMGWAALIVSLVSLFLWPVVLGPTGAILGFMAIARGQRAFGLWSIVIGLVSFAAYLLLIPYFNR